MTSLVVTEVIDALNGVIGRLQAVGADPDEIGAVMDAQKLLRQAAAEGQGIWEARWQALKRGLRHRYDTEHVPARKAEQDSILAEMYAAELPQPDANCECDGGCWSTQGCYRQQANKLTATPTEPTPPPAVSAWQDIATAPKDGTWIVAYFPDFGTWPVLWSTDVFDDGFWSVSDNKFDARPLRGFTKDPTLWQPLPIAPDSAPKGGA